MNDEEISLLWWFEIVDNVPWMCFVVTSVKISTFAYKWNPLQGLQEDFAFISFLFG